MKVKDIIKKLCVESGGGIVKVNKKNSNGDYEEVKFGIFNEIGSIEWSLKHWDKSILNSEVKYIRSDYESSIVIMI